MSEIRPCPSPLPPGEAGTGDCVNRLFAQRRHFTITTRILQGFALTSKLNSTEAGAVEWLKKTLFSRF